MTGVFIVGTHEVKSSACLGVAGRLLTGGGASLETRISESPTGRLEQQKQKGIPDRKNST